MTVDLFGNPLDTRTTGLVSVLPCSVVDVGKQGTRDIGQHDTASSRSQYSPFPAEINALCWELFLRDTTHVFDPFAGWGERGAAAQARGKTYTGYDINPAAIAMATARGASVQLRDSRTAEIPLFDGLLTCPPYWNLESYSAHGLDACPTWDAFLAMYAQVLERCYDAAQVGAMLCIMTGDWRQDGRYYDLTFQTQKIMDEQGATPIDVVVASRKAVSKIKVMIPQAVRLGYTVKVHETLMVWQKR